MSLSFSGRWGGGLVFSKVMRRATRIITVRRSGSGVRVAVGYSFISRLGVSRDITRGNIYLAIIHGSESAFAAATVQRALRHSGLKLLGPNSLIGLRHDVVVGKHLSKRVIRKRISRATIYADIRSTGKD